MHCICAVFIHTVLGIFADQQSLLAGYDGFVIKALVSGALTTPKCSGLFFTTR